MANEKFETLRIQGTDYRTTLTDKFINRKKYESPNEKHIYSFIPGTILEIHVKEGQKVNRDDNLLVLEAMKMKNEVLCPQDGVIKKINIEKNQKIPKGFLMIEYK